MRNRGDPRRSPLLLLPPLMALQLYLTAPLSPPPSANDRAARSSSPRGGRRPAAAAGVRPLRACCDDPDCSGDNEEAAGEERRQEFDVDEIATIAELNELSESIGGPVFDETSDDGDIGAARDALWDYVTGEAPVDVDEMCMGQLSGFAEDLGVGGDFLDGVGSLEEARDAVWDLAERMYESDAA